MRIESIERNEVLRLVRIRTDEGEDFELGLNAEEARGMVPGLLLDCDQVDRLRLAAQRKAIAKKVFGWLDRRRRTALWLRRKLLDEGHDSNAVEAVLEEFRRQGLVCDREYARAWCADQLRRKPVGRRWLLARLGREGVGEEDAWWGIDAELPADAEGDCARAALRRKRFDLSEWKDQVRAMRFLQSRGFGPGCARGAIEDLRRAERGAETGGRDDALDFDDH